MSEKRLRFVGHPDGVDLNEIPVGTEGEFRRAHVPHGGDLPMEIDGLKIPASYRDSLAEQKDNWTEYTRSTKPAKADEKED